MQLPYSNLRIKHQNHEAVMPLILPIQVVCNTSSDLIKENIHINSRLKADWLRLEDAHDGVAVLCGSGPSLKADLHRLWKMQADGAKIFAMNGAAQYLYDHGITPDYQCILDAREETATLIGPAKEHLFASQVHPTCFTKQPSARLWHLQVEGIDEELPEYDRSYCLIGGAASVGNTATCLAYAMGYRDLQIFGYDSSHHDGSGHAFHQAMNDGDPCASVRFNGKDYICSLTMKLQAEKFQETSHALMAEGCKITVHGFGLLPDMFNSKIVPMDEKEKYELMWAQPLYRGVAPGERCVDEFIELTNGDRGIVVDFGCGTGRTALEIHKKTGCEFILLDIAGNCLDEEVLMQHWYTFLSADLRKPRACHVKYGICTDVMEHIEPHEVDNVITNIMSAAENVYFNISLVEDVCGVLIEQKLHLSVRPYSWWLAKFNELGFEVLRSEERGCEAMFFISKGN